MNIVIVKLPVTTVNAHMDACIDVLLTLNLNIILVTDQLNAQILVSYVYYIPLHVSSIMCSLPGGQIIQCLVLSHGIIQI